MGFPGTLRLRDETFVSLSTEVGESIIQHGFRRLFFLNGHGGNMATLQLVVSRFCQLAEGEGLCVAANYWDFIEDIVQNTRRSPPGGIAHAGELSLINSLIDKNIDIHEKNIYGMGNNATFKRIN